MAEEIKPTSFDGSYGIGGKRSDFHEVSGNLEQERKILKAHGK